MQPVTVPRVPGEHLPDQDVVVPGEGDQGLDPEKGFRSMQDPGIFETRILSDSTIHDPHITIFAGVVTADIFEVFMRLPDIYGGGLQKGERVALLPQGHVLCSVSRNRGQFLFQFFGDRPVLHRKTSFSTLYRG